MVRFRMDCWWHGVPVLLRGPLLSLCPVLATDFPPAQAAMATVVLMAGLLLHMRFLPWKMPMVNFVDGCLQSMLLFIVAITPAMGPGSATAIENFHEGIALVTLSCMVIILATLAFVLAFASLYHLAGSASSAQDFIVLNLGRRQSSAEIVQHIKKVSQALLELEVERAKEVLDQMHPGDVSQIINTIELLRTELVQSMDEIRTRGNIASSRVTALRRSVKAQRNRMSDEHGENTLAKASDDPPASGENFFQTSANADPGEDAPTWTESLNEGFYDESRVVKAIL